MLRLSDSMAEVTATGVAHLARLPALEHLDISGTTTACALPTIPAGLAHAGRLTYLSLAVNPVRQPV